MKSTIKTETMMKQIRTAFLLLLVFGGGLSVRATDFGAWSQNLPITFTGYGKSETLTNFPVLVTLGTNLAGFSYTEFASPADGADLRFAAGNKIDELNYEIEKWDTNGTSYVWVQVPLLADTNTQIWAYWSNPGATAPACQTNGAAWSNGFVGVWHLGESASTNRDSTLNRNDGTNIGNASVTSAGRIGSAKSFDGNGDGVDCGSGASLDFALPRTISAWINPTVVKFKGAVMGKNAQRTTVTSYFMSITNGALMAFDGTAWRNSSNMGLAAGNWYHVVCEARGDGLVRYYINGQSAGTSTWSHVDNAAHNVYIGSWLKVDGTYDFNGRIDEVSIANKARGSNWVWASWANQQANSSFGAYGEVTDIATGLSVKALSATDVGATTATLNGKLVDNGGVSATEVVFCWDYTDKGTASTGAWAHVEVAGGSFTNGQPVATALNGLLSGSTYVYRCYASNSSGSDWSTFAQSIRMVSLPAVTNTGAVVLNYNTALLRGAVTETGTQTPSVWFLYWIDGSDTTNSVAAGLQSGACSNQVTDLAIGASNYVYMLMASNAAGVVYSGTNGFSSGRIYYVATNGNNAADGLAWATAVSNVEVAVQRAGPVTGVVMIGNGNFAVTSSWIQVTSPILVTSLNGPANTSLDGANVALRRIMFVNHALARVSGLTMKRGSYNAWGDSNGPGALRLAAGTVSNCIVTANAAYYYGGVQMSGGVLVDCLIHANTAGGSGSGSGGGIYLGGGEVMNCVISNNVVSIYGGGVHMAGGRMRDCQIVRNLNGGTYNPIEGAGVYMTGGTLERCEVKDNNVGPFQRGGGVYMSGGTVLNSLVVNNGCLFQGGGIYMAGSAARVIHTTVTGNRTGVSGHGIYQAAGAVSNSLVIGNGGALYGGRGENVASVGGTISYSASAPVLAGPNNIVVEPRFANPGAGDYRLLPGSPCIDAAAVIPDITAALGGTVRALDGDGDGSALPDMGAFELGPASSLACAFSAPTNEAQTQLGAVLTAAVAGPDTNIVWYGWDIDNDGNWDYQGSDKRTVSHLFDVGFYTVKLAVSNASEGAACIMPNYIRVAPLTNYVARAGGNANIAPYDTWQKAASNILDGVDAAWAMPGEPSVVLVSNGTHAVSRTVVLTGSIRVQSLNGPASTIVDAGATTFGLRRAFYVDSADAVLAGFTGRGGNSGVGFGATGLWLSQGLVSNCIITANSGNGSGTGAFMGGGKLSDTIVSYNTCSSQAGSGGGLNMTGGVAERCQVRNNSNRRSSGSGLTISGGLFTHGVIASNATSDAATAPGGAGISMSGGTIRNSLIAWNGNTYTPDGGGALMSGGIIESCTVVSNKATTVGGGLSVSGGAVSNTISAFNAAPSQVNISGKTNNCYYSCATDLTDGNNGNIVALPTFQNRLVGDFRLARGSAGINQGLKQDWMTGALDLAGAPRLLGAVDMGAYESTYSSGTLIFIR